MIDATDPLVRYMLNTLSESERAVEEERLFMDEDFADLLQMKEHELFDAYVRDDLAPDLRALLEKELLYSADQLDKLAVARTLLAPGAVRPARKWQHALALAASLVIAGGLAFQLRHDRRNGVPFISRRPAAARLPQAPREQSFLLTPGLVRGGLGVTVLHLQPRITRLKFEIELPAGIPAAPLAATLESGQTVVWTQSNLTHEPGGMNLTLNANLLKPGPYTLTLETVPATQYFFELRPAGK